MPRFLFNAVYIKAIMSENVFSDRPLAASTYVVFRCYLNLCSVGFAQAVSFSEWISV